METQEITSETATQFLLAGLVRILRLHETPSIEGAYPFLGSFEYQNLQGLTNVVSCKRSLLGLLIHVARSNG